jgi:small subunit ribosomal protein S20
LGTKRHAQKQQRQNEKRAERNKAVRSATRTAVKKAVKAAVPGAAPEALAESVKTGYHALDVAGRKGVMHKRTVARRKSRLAKRVNKAARGEASPAV